MTDTEAQQSIFGELLAGEAVEGFLVHALRIIRLRSLVEVSYDHTDDQVRIRTFEGNPEIFNPETNTSLALTAGQETRPFDENPVVVEFDTAAAETWWESPEWQAVNDESGAEAAKGLGTDLDQVDRRVLIFLGAMCVLVLFGGIVLAGLIVILWRKNKSQPKRSISSGIDSDAQAASPSKSRSTTCLLVSLVLVLLTVCCGMISFLGRIYL